MVVSDMMVHRVLTVVQVRTEAGAGMEVLVEMVEEGDTEVKGRMVVMAVTGELVVMVETVDMEE
ncbi:hypothetical protein K8G04_004748 [Salmonella enterica]|nr:hypothetical protein [Salmonella enterica]EDY0488573.1 hypothetical protein [Salmonella enterica subsp. enterica]EAU9882504.1 hypothetical protein [Salmonella enterica]EBG8862982.1 hypothetical protein [Salmonella enterica]ECR4794669.1 hypothetical protein [Salmonella enterica]